MGINVPQIGMANHAPVTVALVSNAVVAIVLAFIKARWQVDFSGQEAHLQAIATAVGYLVANKQQTNIK